MKRKFFQNISTDFAKTKSTTDAIAKVTRLAMIEISSIINQSRFNMSQIIDKLIEINLNAV